MLVSPDDFLAAEQVLISLLALGIGGLFGLAVAHLQIPAVSKPTSETLYLLDWRLWAVGASSLGMGLLGTRILLRREETSLTFPAYRMASLLAAFGAALGRGELRVSAEHWSSWAAILLACVVVGVASINSQNTSTKESA